MKIAFYSFLNLRNGAGFERWIEQVAPRLKNIGHDIIIITSKYGMENDMKIQSLLSKSGIKVYEFNNWTKPFKIPKIWEAQNVLNLISDIDILYFNNAYALNEVIIEVLRKMTKVKVISGHHGTFPEQGNIMRRMYHRFINKKINKRYDGHHALNGERQNVLKSWGYKNVHKIPYGVNTEKYKPGDKADIFTIMFAGNMFHQKGIDRFAAVVKYINSKLSSTNNEIQFLVYGSGPLSHIADNLEKQYQNVKYIGYAYGEDLEKAFRKAHVFIFPSRFEEFGLVSLEAQSSGTPVIASDIPGPRDIIRNGQTGFLVNPEILEEMIKPLLHLKSLYYSNDQKYHDYCLNARKNALRFDWNIVIQEFDHMLSDTLLS